MKTKHDVRSLYFIPSSREAKGERSGFHIQPWLCNRTISQKHIQVCLNINGPHFITDN